MRNIKIFKTVKEPLITISLALCAFSLSMPTFYFNLALSIAFLTRVVYLNKRDFALVFYSKLFKTIFISMVLIIIGFIYTKVENYNIGITLFIKRIPFLLIPFLFIGVTKRIVKFTLIGFLLGVFVGSLICLINVSITENVYGYIKQIYISNWYWNSIILDPIDKHPSYFSIYACLSFFIGLDFFLNDKRSIFKIFYTLLMLFFVGIILTLEARIVIITFPLVFLVYLIFKTRKILIGLAFFMLLTIFGTFYFIHHPARFHNIRILKLPKDLNIRMDIYDAATNLISKNPLFGVGSGDITQSLNTEYILKGHNYIINYNCHNQFFEEWARGGLLSFMALVVIFILMMKNAIAQNKTIFLVFLLMMIIFSLVESYLNRQQGITFFIFFGALFYYYHVDYNYEKSQ
ncbi:O-antigen ligase family protein [Aestuariivivens sediminis]|uniref:O-antigen ligase family protein n=1 Tax=Aestuariivivens sediminis TaxID=2913557 RepID=UPI001F5A4890|nr:O-antigen ligase family protein [Aestuariivivens sediminis]